MRYLFLSNVPVNEPLQFPEQGAMERAVRKQDFFLHISQIPCKVPINKKFIPYLKGPRKASFLFPHKQDPCGKRRPFP